MNLTNSLDINLSKELYAPSLDKICIKLCKVIIQIYYFFFITNLNL